MDINIKLGYREAFPSELDAEQLIFIFGEMVRALQSEADRTSVELDWTRVRVGTEEVEAYSFLTSGRGLTVKVYGKKA